MQIITPLHSNIIRISPALRQICRYKDRPQSQASHISLRKTLKIFTKKLNLFLWGVLNYNLSLYQPVKTYSIFTVLSLGCLSSSLLFVSPQSQAGSLLYGLDFNTLGGNGIDFRNIGTGTTPVSGTSGYYNYSPSFPLNDGGFSHSVHGGTFQFSDTTNGIAGASMSKGFSVSLDVRASSGVTWGDAITFGFGNGTDSFKVTRNGGTGWNLYTSGSLRLNGLEYLNSFTTSSNDAWLNLNFVFKQNQVSIYNAGNLLQTVTLSNSTGSDLGHLSLIRGGGTQTKVGTLIDNVGIYDGVLSDADFAYISKNGLVASIPEPATATLSLLGLAALSLRRKRSE